MAQSRRPRARLSSRIARLVRLAAPAGRLPSSDHTPAAGGIRFFRLCQLMWVAAAAVPSASARPLSGEADMRQNYARRLS
jgi:hypothetical protein